MIGLIGEPCILTATVAFLNYVTDYDFRKILQLVTVIVIITIFAKVIVMITF